MRPAVPALALTAALAAATPAGAVSPLEPYQMVRSLQLVQDRIAGGDHAALPMQNKLLAMIDERMRTATALDFADRRNFEALLVYGMSGGNPRTIGAVLSRLHPDADERRIGRGVLDFLHGQPARAHAALASVEPLAMPTGLGAFVALVKGSVAGPEQAESALRHFDQARLLGQGTLVEEAALRRSIPLAVSLHDPKRFLYASSSYVRSFLRSPYASEFAQSFVAGIIALYDVVDMAAVDEIIAGMTPEQQDVIYLRLARKGAIDAMPALSDHAARRLAERSTAKDSRALLYSAMAALSAGDVEGVARMLGKVDPAQLSESDRRLLDATKTTVSGVLTLPEAPLPEAKPATREAPVADVEDDAAVTEAGPGPAAPQAAPRRTTAAPPAAPAVADLAIVTSAREKLAEIDKLLQETSE